MPLVDWIYVVLLLVGATVYEYLYFWPRFRAAVAAEHAGARLRAYRRGVIGQWLFAGAALAIWATHGRSRELLGLVTPHGWRLGVGIGVVLASVAFLALQLWSVLRLPAARRIAARPKLGTLAFMVPHTAREEGWFVALSLTAGFCEELLYRGYLPWFFTPWLGRPLAMLLIVVVFGLSHLYQGRNGAIKATLAGAVMAGIVLATGSLIPAMIAHAVIDIGGGTVGYLLLRDQLLSGSAAPAASASRIQGG